MLQEADSSGLIEHGAQPHKILLCGFSASAHSLMNSGIYGNATAGGPMQAASSLLQYLPGPACGYASLHTKTLSRQDELQGFLQDDAMTQVLLLETPQSRCGRSCSICMKLEIAARSQGCISGGLPQARFGKGTQAAWFAGAQLWDWDLPCMLSRGNNYESVSQDSKVSAVSLFEMLRLDIAVEMAIDRLASSWHVAVPSKRERFCFTAALLDSLCSTRYTLSESELNLLTDRHHKLLLHNGSSPTMHNSMQASLPHLQMCDPDSGWIQILPCNAAAGRCSSQAATAWSLADEAIGRC